MHPMTIGGRTLIWGERTYVMGILNLTPDSFSGDGLLASPPALYPYPQKTRAGGHTSRSERSERGEERVEQARRFLAAGADILDVGGESTRPGSQPVNAEEELRRVLPAIQAISTEFPQALISIDTYKAVVAEEALQAGAAMINDVWGLRADPALAGVAARYKAPVVLMHNRSKPANVECGNGLEMPTWLQNTRIYWKTLNASCWNWSRSRAAGIPDENIILDPGIGFGKTVSQNLRTHQPPGRAAHAGLPDPAGTFAQIFYRVYLGSAGRPAPGRNGCHHRDWHRTWS